jgi:hypothetical protein
MTGSAVGVDEPAAARFPRTRQEACARRRDRQERDAGGALFTHEELMPDAALAANETYEHTPPTRPYGQESFATG